jgi:hypothetical protein
MVREFRTIVAQPMVSSINDGTAGRSSLHGTTNRRNRDCRLPLGLANSESPEDQDNWPVNGSRSIRCYWRIRDFLCPVFPISSFYGTWVVSSAITEFVLACFNIWHPVCRTTYFIGRHVGGDNAVFNSA